MNLGNLIEIIVYYLLIRGMTYLDHWDGVSHGWYTSVYGYILDITYNKS